MGASFVEALKLLQTLNIDLLFWLPDSLLRHFDSSKNLPVAGYFLAILILLFPAFILARHDSRLRIEFPWRMSGS